MIITKFTNLVFKWVPRDKIPIADWLSQSATTEQRDLFQLQHKKLPKGITFVDGNDKEVHYSIDTTEDKENKHPNDSYPIIVDNGKEKFRIRIKQNGDEVETSPLNEVDLQNITHMRELMKIKKPKKAKKRSLKYESDVLNDEHVHSDEDDEFAEIVNIEYENTGIYHISNNTQELLKPYKDDLDIESLFHEQINDDVLMLVRVQMEKLKNTGEMPKQPENSGKQSFNNVRKPVTRITPVPRHRPNLYAYNNTK